jgi:hypothetical protein
MERRRDPGGLTEARSMSIPGVPPTCPVLTPGLGGGGRVRGPVAEPAHAELNAAASGTLDFISTASPNGLFRRREIPVNGTIGAHHRTAPFQMMLIAPDFCPSSPFLMLHPVDTPPPRNPYPPRTRWLFGVFTGKNVRGTPMSA